MSQRTLCSLFPRRSFLTVAASSALLLGGLVTSSAQASPLLTSVSVPYKDGLRTDSSNCSGYQFVLNTPVIVTDLGAWDNGADGFTGTVRVQLWTDNGATNLADLTLPGTGGTLDSNNYRYFPLTTPVALAAGTYRLGATFSGATLDAFWNLGSVTHSPEITSTLAAWGTNNAAPLNGSGASNDAYTGANLIWAVPEPTSLGLLGLTGLALMRRRR